MTASGYDIVIVGAGSAGCVLASRFSEDPSCSVLLLEAGPDYAVAATPPHLLDGMHGPNVTGHDWGVTGLVIGQRVLLPRGRVVGGCSSVNACFALRGSPFDYDGWGLDGWAFADVLPSFVRLERDLDFGAASYHGDSGPVPIRRYAGDELSPIAAAALASLPEAGIPLVDDHNAPFAVGGSALPVNVLDGRRMSTAATYLEPARARGNLDVRGDCVVRRVVLAGGRAVGVELSDGSVIAAGEVVVSAGSYLSPGLLEASGVSNPAIGTNLVDHPAVSVDLPYYGPTVDRAVFQVAATLHSSQSDPATSPPDLQVVAAGPYPQEPGAPPVFFVAAALLKPHSRGFVGEDIDLGYYEDPDDLARIVEGLARVEDVVAGSEIQKLCRGERLTPTLHTAEEREGFVRTNTWTYHHPVGTCAMGSVVDEQCRVYDVDGLSVVDASVMPDIPSANTNLPTIMVAERVAAMRGAGVEAVAQAVSA